LSDHLSLQLVFPLVQHGLLTEVVERRYMFFMPFQRTIRIIACAGIVLLSAKAARSSPNPADKPGAWVEVTTPHFSVMSDDGEKTGRRIADQFEQIRSLYSRALSHNLRLDPGIPIQIIAVKNEKSLSQLIPEYWAEKGHTHPAGIFVPGAEKNFIALRTDVQGEFPYLTIYHEYVHLIVSLNFQHFPLWLNEGFATFFGSATVAGKAGKLGQPNESELFVLSQTKLLPLDVLFRVGHDSPYYNEADKTNIFYAESWALVHYLMTDEVRKKKENQIDKYIGLVESGGDPVDSRKNSTPTPQGLLSLSTRSASLKLPEPNHTRSEPFRRGRPSPRWANLTSGADSWRQLERRWRKRFGWTRIRPRLRKAWASSCFAKIEWQKRKSISRERWPSTPKAP
jgi:Protein of unknown function (DUF1570)